MSSLGLTGEQDNFLGKLNQLVDQAEKVLLGACQRETYDFVFIEPLWLTWTLEHFGELVHLIQSSILTSDKLTLFPPLSLTTRIIWPSYLFSLLQFSTQQPRLMMRNTLWRLGETLRQAERDGKQSVNGKSWSR